MGLSLSLFLDTSDKLRVVKSREHQRQIFLAPRSEKNVSKTYPPEETRAKENNMSTPVGTLPYGPGNKLSEEGRV